MPKIQDVFAMLASVKTFTKLQAYQQLLLGEESQKYVVINTQ
jgi:hypothetical protein